MSDKVFVPSIFQKTIFETIQAITRDIVVEAVAGSGKTTTLIHACTLVDQSKTILILAFNKERAVESGDKLEKARLTHATASTLHSLGYRSLSKHNGKKLKKVDYKYHNLADELFRERYPEWINHVSDSGRVFYTQMGRTVRDDLLTLASFARLTLTNPASREDISAMALRYSLDIDLEQDALFATLPDLMQQAEVHTRTTGEIDYTDMIYLPVQWNITVPQYDLVFVDEAQDLNACQLALAKKARKPGGHMVFVGDRNQAIYAFAGADWESIPRIIEQTNAMTLPLSVNYRCPTSVLKLAQEIVPHIEPREDAPEGQVVHLPADKLYETAQPGDVILCRLTAPLISTCLEFIQRGIPAKVKGRDIGKQLNAIVDKVTARETFVWEYFLNHLTEYKAQHVKMLMQREADELQITSFTDRVEAVAVCYETLEASDPDDLKKKIGALFSDDKPIIWLSTVHRAKGSEADNVFIIRPDALPLPAKGDQLTQEMNLRYVAITRAMVSLSIVGGEFTPGPYATPTTDEEAEEAAPPAPEPEPPPAEKEPAEKEAKESTEPPAEAEPPKPEEPADKPAEQPAEVKHHVAPARPAPPKPSLVEQAVEAKPGLRGRKPSPAAVRASLEIIAKALEYAVIPDNIPPEMVKTAFAILHTVLTQDQENPTHGS